MTTRKAKPVRSIRYQSFEERTTATLESQNLVLDKQNDVLGKLERKLESPVLNGGFDDLVKRVEKIDTVTDKLRECQEGTSKKIGDLHTVILDPETGLYHVVKGNSKWINTTTRALKWLGGLLGAGLLTGIGKLLYDIFSGHIHYTP